MKLQIILMRHATRSAMLDFNSGQSESSLNALGFAQAEELARLVQTENLPKPTRIYASPKLRARQTVQPLAAQTGLDVQIFEDLDERRDSETLGHFEARVKNIAEHIQIERGVVVLCTHLDVLDAATQLWPTDFSEQQMAKPWSTLEYQIFNVKDGIFESGLRGRVEAGR